MMTDEQRRDEEREPTVHVVDRRRINADGSERADQSEAAASAGEASAGSRDQPQAEPQALLPVADLLRVFMAELNVRAWIHMGLIANPTDNKETRDMAQARLAIDCIYALVEKLSPHVQPKERDELQRMLTDLRINFVQQSGA